MTKNTYVLENSANSNYSNQRALIVMYLGLVQGTIDVISSVSKDYRNLNLDYLRENILAKINQSSTQVYGGNKFSAQNL